MKFLQAIKTYFTLGEDAYNVIKKWKDEDLRKKLVEIFSLDGYKTLPGPWQSDVCRMLSIFATSNDLSEQRNSLNNVFKLINDKNLNNSKYFNYYLNLIFYNPNFDVSSSYDLEGKTGIDPEEIYEIIKAASNGVTQKYYMESKCWEGGYRITLICSTQAFKNLPDNLKDSFYLKLKEIRTSNEYNKAEKDTLLEEFYCFFWHTPRDIDEVKFLDYFNIILYYPVLGDAIWAIMDEADDAEKTIVDVKKWIDIYAKLYVNEQVDPSDFYYIVFNNKLATNNMLDLILNNIFSSKLSKADLFEDVAFLIDNIDFNTAVNIILALFKMPSQKRYDFISNIICYDEVLFNNQLLAFIDKVINTTEDKLDELKFNMEYEVVYRDMPFSKATVEHNKEAMDYLDSHPETKSTSLIRIPVLQKRDEYKL